MNIFIYVVRIILIGFEGSFYNSFSTVFWSVAYKDWDVNAQPTHERAMSYLTTRIHPGAIILLHAVSKTNAEIMDQLLTTWEQMGYSFRTLDELPLGLTF